jgi:hypothetical protein
MRAWQAESGLLLAVAVSVMVSGPTGSALRTAGRGPDHVAGFSAHPAAPDRSPARPTDESSAPASYAIVVGEVWIPPASEPVRPESPATEPLERFVEPPEPPPRV